MGETETPDAPTEEEDDVPGPTDPSDPDEEPHEPVEASVEPTLSLEEFGLLEGLTPPTLAALSRWVHTSGRPRHGTASAWQQAMRDMQAYIPH